MSNMSKIHIWIGTTMKTEEEYSRYFELDYSTEGDFDDPEYKECLFCIDTTQKWYDEDMIGIIPIFSKIQPIEELLGSIPIDKTEIENVIRKCCTLGMEFGNAIFYYTDSTLKIDKPYKDSYNDLKYIGVFNSFLK